MICIFTKGFLSNERQCGILILDLGVKAAVLPFGNAKDGLSFLLPRLLIVHMYTIGDKIVHPMHGAGIIENIVSERVAGTVREYYVFRVPTGRVDVLIPVDSCDSLGVRPVTSAAEAEHLLEIFPTLEIGPSSNWNRRYRDNMDRLKSGDLTEVGRVVRALLMRERNHTLSSVERRMLISARQILLSELSLATGRDPTELGRLLYESLPPPQNKEG